MLYHRGAPFDPLRSEQESKGALDVVHDIARRRWTTRRIPRGGVRGPIVTVQRRYISLHLMVDGRTISIEAPHGGHRVGWRSVRVKATDGREYTLGGQRGIRIELGTIVADEANPGNEAKDQKSSRSSSDHDAY